MTKLNKPITRKTDLLLDNRAKARTNDSVAVTLYPNGTIGFRAARRRKEYVLPLNTVYALAIRASVEAEKREKKKAKEAKK